MNNSTGYMNNPGFNALAKIVAEHHRRNHSKDHSTDLVDSIIGSSRQPARRIVPGSVTISDCSYCLDQTGQVWQCQIPPGESTEDKNKKGVRLMRKLISLRQLVDEEGVDMDSTYVDPDDLAELEDEEVVE